MDPNSRVEKLNSMIRAWVLVWMILVVSFAYIWLLLHGQQPGALEGTVISTLTGAFVWWFKSRDEKQAQANRPPGLGGTP